MENFEISSAAPTQRQTTADLGTVAILGLGLIGGSIGMALRSSGAARAVIGWDVDAAANTTALNRGAADRIAVLATEAVVEADIVVLSPPVEEIVPLITSIVSNLRERAVVTDVGSAKARIVQQAEELVGGRFVGGHPMAGLEHSGIDSASPTLFESAAWIITPSTSSDADAVSVVESLATAVGARPRSCDPESHDRIIGYL